MSFFTELKRRNVFRVAAAYAVVAWLLIEVSDTVFPRLNLPDWTVTFVIVLALLGLPLALFLSWAYELTPEGVKRSEEAGIPDSNAPKSGQKLNYVIMAGLVLALGYFVWERGPSTGQVEPAAPAGEAKRPTIAVLPFVNMSDDAGQDYFSDGITEEIINLLVRQPVLKVVSRTSAFSFKGKNLDIPTIAGQLGAEYIVEGSVRRAGETLRITAQLIEADTDTHLWSDSYDRASGDIFVVQDELAAAITAALGGSLGFVAQANVGTDRPEDLDAYEDFLRARAHLRAREVFAAQQLFARVVDRAPDFAEGWALYSISLHYLNNQGFGAESAENDPITRDGAVVYLARHAAKKALDLAAEAAMTQYALGLVARDDRREYDELAHYARALEADPGNPLVLEDLVQTRNQFAILDGAAEVSERLRQADPLWFVGREVAAHHLLLMDDRFDEVLRIREQGISEKPDAFFVHAWRIQQLLFDRRWTEAEAAQAEARKGMGEHADLYFVQIDIPALRDWTDSQGGIPFAKTHFFAESMNAPDPNFLRGLFVAFEDDPDRIFDLAIAGSREVAKEVLQAASTTSGKRRLWNHPRMEDYIRFVERRWDLPVTRIWREFGWPRFCRPVGEEDFECGGAE